MSIHLETVVKLAGFDKDMQLLKTFSHSKVLTSKLWLIQRDVLPADPAMELDWGHHMTGNCYYLLMHNHNPRLPITVTLSFWYFGKEPSTFTIPPSGWCKLQYIDMAESLTIEGSSDYPTTIIYAGVEVEEPQ